MSVAEELLTVSGSRPSTGAWNLTTTRTSERVARGESFGFFRPSSNGNVVPSLDIDTFRHLGRRSVPRSLAVTGRLHRSSPHERRDRERPPSAPVTSGTYYPEVMVARGSW